MYVEDYLRDYEITTLKIVNHPDTLAFLKIDSIEEMNESGMIPLLTNVLRNEAFSQSDIAKITLVLEEIATMDSAGEIDAATELMNEQWYQEVSGVGSPEIISRVIRWQDRDVPVISVVKRIANPFSLQPFGMLVIDLNYQRLNDVARKITPGITGYLFIVDQHGNYVYHPDKEKIGTAYRQEYWERMNGGASGSFVGSGNNADLITFSDSERTGWTYATAIPYSEVTQGMEYIKQMILKTVILSLVFVVIIGGSFSSGVLTPIKRLQQYMKRVEKADFSQRLPVESADEIGQLSAGFNKMMEQLSSLVREVYVAKIREGELRLRQKEMEIKTLQSQMNPHFLYNALETVRGMAFAKEEEDIAAISSSMAKLLRYNLREQQTVVTVEQEIAMCKLYLRIQKYRFDEKLEYQFQIPEWGRRQKITRFSLQPLIENAIVHGVEPIAGSTVIDVSAEKESADAFILWIKDTGAGMSSETRKRLQADIRQKDVSDGGSHIGMVNVHRRNQLVFGQQYGLLLKRADGNGTIVGIRLPYEAGKEAE